MKKRITKSTRWYCFMAMLYLFCTQVVLAQEQSISGSVLDENNVGIPGVNILVQGTNKGAVTNFDGNFKINASSGDILVFSYLGYKTQNVVLGNRTTITVTMVADVEQLDELVVVGYGARKKSDLTGSVSTVKGESLTVAPMANLSAGLSGKLTGVVTSQQTGLPGFDNTTIRVRGTSTLNNNSALIIVDGVERPLGRINPNEIESITVLKDAASAAIYGARAANGVILVTTKRGGNRKATFNFSTSYGIQTILNSPQMMNSLEFATHFNEAQLNSNPNLDPSGLRFSPQDIEDIRNGLTPDTDWYAEVVQNNAPILQHNLTIDGGNEKTGYFLSFGHLDQEGLYKSSGFKSYSLRSNIDTKIGKNLTIGLDVVGRLEETTNSAFEGLNDNPDRTNFATWAIFAAVGNGIPTFAPYVDGDGDGEVDDLGFDGKIDSAIGRANHSGLYERNNNVFQSALNLNYDFPFLEGLFAKARYSYDASFNNRRAFKTPFTYYQPTSAGFSVAESAPSPSLTENRGTWNQRTAQFSLGYDKEFGKNKIGALLLYEQVEISSSNLGAFRDGFLGTTIDQFIAGSEENASNSGSAREQARIGYVGRVNYDRAGKYLFQANFRYDGSHRFAKSNRFGFFPAVSAGWRISKEDFFPQDGAISNLKLRASWGKSGNDRLRNGDFQYLSQFDIKSSVSALGGSTRTGISESILSNQSVTWEAAIGSNIGFELGLLNNKIGFEFDYFTKDTKDILIASTGNTPDTFAGRLPELNLGETKSNGIEAEVRYSDNFGDFSLTTSANITYATSEVVNIAEAENVNPWFKLTGQPIGVERGLVALGLFQSREELDNSPRQDQDEANPNSTLFPGDIKYQDVNEDGVIDGDDRTIIGKSALPEVVFGFNLNMQYKGFGLVANFQGATGYTRYIEYVPFSVESNSRAALVDSWRPDNVGARFPRLTVGGTANNSLRSSFWLNDVTYFRLRNVQLSYTLPSSALESVGIDSVRLHLSSTNLFTLTNVKDVDPEGPSTERPYYPQMKSTTFGVNITF